MPITKRKESIEKTSKRKSPSMKQSKRTHVCPACRSIVVDSDICIYCGYVFTDNEELYEDENDCE